ncbi:MAG: hypothetical protein NTY30_02400 [Candidatus Berkelbacteria bacterium]|nr:hypothetical protein [Candidatus Berkelbacteria bacterium]
MSCTTDADWLLVASLISARPKRRSNPWSGFNSYVPADFDRKARRRRATTAGKPRQTPGKRKLTVTEIQELQAALHRKHPDIDLQLPPAYQHLVEDKPAKNKPKRSRVRP